jgi:hypothetical protein
MQTTPATILGQISAEKTKISERLARLNADRETIATQLTDLEVTERVLTRVGTTSPARRTRSASAREAKTSDAERGSRRQPRAGTSKSAGRQAGARTASLGERVLALATGKTRRELYAACPGDRPNHVGMAVQRHMRAGRIQESEGKLYAI